MLATTWRMEHIQARMDASDEWIVEKVAYIEKFLYASYYSKCHIYSILFFSFNTLLSKYHYQWYLHITDEVTEAEGGQKTSPRPYL